MFFGGCFLFLFFYNSINILTVARTIAFGNVCSMPLLWLTLTKSINSREITQNLTYLFFSFWKGRNFKWYVVLRTKLRIFVFRFQIYILFLFFKKINVHVGFSSFSRYIYLFLNSQTAVAGSKDLDFFAWQKILY